MRKSDSANVALVGKNGIHDFVSLYEGRFSSEVVTREASPDVKNIPLIRASTDIEAVQRWLKEYRESPQTYRAYEKESLRLLLWCEYVVKKNLKDLTRDDVDDFFVFMASPPIEWVFAPSVPRCDERWRPFRKPITQKGLGHSKVILDGLFSYLVDARVLAGNPFSLIRRKNRGIKKARLMESNERRNAFPMETCSVIRDFLAGQYQIPGIDYRCAVRDELIFELFLCTGGRLEELSRATMQDLRCDKDGWWLYVFGKGEKAAELAIGNDLYSLIVRSREAFGLPPCPTSSSPEPIFLALRNGYDGKPKGLTGNMVYRRIKGIFEGAAVLAGIRNMPGSATHLRRASTHWIRHTTLTQAFELTNDLRFVMDVGRHENINTTMNYVSTDRSDHHKRAVDLQNKFR